MYVADIERALAVLGNRFVQIYGQGESPMTITALSRAHHADRDHPRRAARLALGRAAAQRGRGAHRRRRRQRRCRRGEAGEVTVRGAPVMRGYWRNPDATARRCATAGCGTGDVGALDDDGFLTLRTARRT